MTETQLPYQNPEPCWLIKRSVSALAEKFSDEIGYNPGDDLDAVVTKLGGRVTYQDFWELESTEDGSIQIDGVRNFHIFIGAHTSQDRNRFTIAHELGHYVLHYLLPLANGKNTAPVKARRYGGKDRTEYEANWFAAAMLMPTAPFKSSYLECESDIVELAARFQVSVSAALVRAKTLGLK